MNDRLDLTDLIHRAENGDADAADRLFSATYASLCKLARMRLVTGGRNTLLDTGSLVHESYLRFARFATSGALNIQDRVHFLRWAGRVMRSVIVDFARRRTAGRHGGGAVQVALTTGLADERGGSAEQILAVHEALDDLAAVAPRLAQVVELRYFGGLTEPEIAEALGVTDRTVRRDWQKGQLLLREALE
jgi:RNA polymerase sigma factor (TIGR02999 family)